MKSFNVYQMSENSPFLRELFFMSEDDIEKVTDQYELVATIEADDLEDVFDIGNIGPESKITRHKSMRSVSVGDIIEASKSGKFFVVAHMGFKQLHANKIGI